MPRKYLNIPDTVPGGAETAYSVGRMMLLLKKHAPLSAKELAELVGENPRTYQRYLQGLELAGVTVLRDDSGRIMSIQVD